MLSAAVAVRTTVPELFQYGSISSTLVSGLYGSCPPNVSFVVGADSVFPALSVPIL